MDPCTPPLRCRPVDAHGRVAAGAVDVEFAPVDHEFAANTGPVRFPGLAATHVAGVEVTDLPGCCTLWLIPAAAPCPVRGGAEVLIPAGVLRVRLADCAVLTDGARAATGAAARTATTVAQPVGAGLGDGALPRSQADTQG